MFAAIGTGVIFCRAVDRVDMYGVVSLVSKSMQAGGTWEFRSILRMNIDEVRLEHIFAVSSIVATFNCV